MWGYVKYLKFPSDDHTTNVKLLGYSITVEKSIAAVTMRSSFIYESRKRVSNTGTALLPRKLVSVVEYLAATMISPAMAHM